MWLSLRIGWWFWLLVSESEFVGESEFVAKSEFVAESEN